MRLLVSLAVGVVSAAALISGTVRGESDRVETGSPVESPGERLFKHNFGLPKSWAIGRLGDNGDGLGPVFNAFSCAGCHAMGGPGGAGTLSNNVRILSFVVPQGLDRAALERHLSEAQRVHPGFSSRAVTVTLHRFGLPPEGDGPAYEEYLAKLLDEIGFDDARQEPQRAKVGRNVYEIAQRSTPPLWGLGVIEDFRQRGGDDIRRRNAQEQSRKYPEITGRVPRSGRQAEAWYGSRGQIQTLHQFNLIACSNELGLEVPGVQQPESPVEPTGFRDRKLSEVKLDLTEDQCRELTRFVASLPRPEQQIPDDPDLAQRLREGEQVFVRARCDGCHTRNLGWINGIHSDMMMHDMGRALCDEGKAIAELQKGELIPKGMLDADYWGGIASGNIFVPPKVVDSNCGCEWRTPPLWGCADSAPYMHDGRAPTLHDAIIAHGGEADLSRRAYESLIPEERELLLEYLGSLRAPTSEASQPAELAQAAMTSAPAAAAGASAPAAVAEEGVPAAEAAPVENAARAEDAAPANPAPESPPADPVAAQPAPEAVVEDVHAPAPGQITPLAVDERTAKWLQTLLGASKTAVAAAQNQIPPSVAGRALPHYALGLAAKQRLDHRGAMEHFAAAARAEGSCRWLAERVLVREALRTRDYAAAIERLEQAAQRLAKAETDDPLERRETARWIGRVLAWLGGPADEAAAAPLAAAAATSIRKAFDADLQRELDAGADETRRIRQSLLNERADLIAAEQDAARAKSADLAEQQTELEVRRDELKSTAEEWKKTFADKTREIDVQLAELQQQVEECEATDRNLQQQLVAMQARFQFDLQFGRAGRDIARNEDFALVAAVQMQEQLAVVQRQIDENAAKHQRVLAAGRQLTARRQALVAQYAQATGQARGEMQSLSKGHRLLERQTPDTAVNAAEASRRVKALDRKLRSLDAYDPLDFPQLAQTLLDRVETPQQ